jgi:nitrate/TMAO reductase-like tetraheme cytochrome c subunit
MTSPPPGATDADDGCARRTRVVLAAAHRDHDTANLSAFCQRCHMIHDRPEHRRRRWATLFRRKALGDLFRGPYG